ncbi:tRNA pseudouridine(38-40) synthase TruA [Caldalkalibacillus mannanilyticus]|uniref:tRNA pseudouridine(38-40) synthase TruA n=1 Tax=Caldalkalibacillus mannanilyticus TaxID=1418 RepID=UPI00046B052B|nr:tRNA pseudouridine(38-40) synthase TruA [Caldalkalibacillus mannanilyticus]
MTEGTSEKRKYKCTVAYDGTNYAGFQHQQNALSIQEAIEKALYKLHQTPVKIFGSGRTDAGVHARGQVFHFESELAIQESNWTRAINALLSPDIRIQHTEKVDLDFHARHDVLKKEYRYFLHLSRTEDPFKRLYQYRVSYDLDFAAMLEAARLFLGEHDFTAFCSKRTTVRSRIRTIYRLDLEKHGDKLVLICEGNGFLFNMVRIITGTLIAVGRKRLSYAQVKQALETLDRSLVGPTAPPHGLFLWKVSYPEDKKLLSL